MDDCSADRPLQERSERAPNLRDISALPTHQVTQGGQGLAVRSAEPVGEVSGSGLRPPGQGNPRLRGAEADEQEAARLQALAQQMEQHLWACSE